MSKSIALQTKQILQDLGASSSFYESNAQSFLFGSKSKVAESCKFDFVKELEKNGCHGKLTNGEREKIDLLINSMNEESSYKAKSLNDGILYTYSSNKYGFENNDSNQCPLRDSAFPANSQLTDDAVEKIFSAYNDSQNSTISKETLLDRYPQLALIYHANKASRDFLPKFEEYMKSYGQSNKTKKEYLLDFFFSKDNKDVLALGVSRRCNQITSNITAFVCSNMDEISPNDSKIAKILLDEYNIKKSFQDQKKEVRENPDSYRTYGYLCEAQAKKINSSTQRELSSQSLANNVVEKNKCKDFKIGNHTIDNWYNCFNEDIRTEQDKDGEIVAIKNFCDRWRCEDKDAKETISCKAGGPLSSKDLGLLKLNDDKVFGQIAFLQVLEGRQEAARKYMAAIQSGEPVSEEIRNTLGISEFDLNAFGAEAVMKMAGLPSTPVILASITQDMHDKGIKPSTPEEIREVITRATNLAPKVASNSSDDDFNMTPTVASTPAVASASNWKNTNYIKPEPSPIAKTKHKIVEAPSKRNPEVQQMMDDLQEIMKAGKDTSTTDDGDEAASTSFSGGASASANSKKQAKTIQGLTSSDLETWAQKLKAKETTLNFRETLADQRDAEYWRNKALSEGGEKEKGRSIASVDEKDSQARSGSNGQASLSSSDNAKGKSKAELAAEVSASSTGLIVTPEKLDKLEKMDLKNFGVNIEEPFVISVRMNGKLIHVRVAKVEMKGREFLAPRLTDDNKEAKEVILNSPLFKEFRYFYEKENSSYFPVKSANN